MNVIGLLRTLEAITRPPRMGHDDDRPLPDYEPMSPDGYYGYAEPNLGADTEPGLTPDELVGVRGLLQERYEPQLLMPCPVDDCEFGGSSYDEVNTHSYWDHLQPNPFEISADPLVEHKSYPGLTKTGDFRWFNVKVTKSSASNHTGTGAEPAPSPTVVQSAPPPTVDGEGPSEVSDIPASPSEGRPPHPVPREQRQGTYCEDYETDGCSVDVCPEGCYHALKFRDDAAAEWIGEAVPVISGVLAAHRPAVDYTGVYCNTNSDDGPHDYYENWAAWRAHVAPLIAAALAPQPK